MQQRIKSLPYNVPYCTTEIEPPAAKALKKEIGIRCDCLNHLKNFIISVKH